jgi:hypothetical protein
MLKNARLRPENIADCVIQKPIPIHVPIFIGSDTIVLGYRSQLYLNVEIALFKVPFVFSNFVHLPELTQT